MYLPQSTADNMSRAMTTHPIQRAPGQYTFSRSGYAAPVAVQVPLDCSSVDLGKHGGYLLDVRWVDPTPGSMRGSPGSEEEIADSERAQNYNKEKRG